MISTKSKIYTQGYKFGTPRRTISPLSSVGGFTFAGVSALLRNTWGWSRMDHLNAARAHDTAAFQTEKAWSKAQDVAHRRVFGTKPTFSDYRISGIGRDEYDEKDKNKLRALAHRISEHHHLAALHRRASQKVTRMKAHKYALVITLDPIRFSNNEIQTSWVTTARVGGRQYDVSVPAYGLSRRQARLKIMAAAREFFNKG